MGDAYSTRQVVYTAPAIEPVSVEEMVRQCRITDRSEDDLLAQYITAARTYVEDITGRKLISQSWDAYFESLDDPLILPFAPLVSVTSVKYQDTGNAQQTLAATYYEAAERDGRPIVRAKYNQSYPSTLGHADDVVIRASYGYGTTAASVPAPLRQVVKWFASHWFENREPVNVGNIVTPIPQTIEMILLPYRVVEFR